MSIGQIEMSIGQIEMSIGHSNVHSSIGRTECPVDIQMSIRHIAEVLDMYALRRLNSVAATKCSSKPPVQMTKFVAAIKCSE